RAPRRLLRAPRDASGAPRGEQPCQLGEALPAGRWQLQRLQRGEALLQVCGDERLVLVDRAGGVEDVAQLGDVVGGEVGAAHAAVQALPLPAVGTAQGEGEQDGALALAQVVTGALA